MRTPPHAVILLIAGAALYLPFLGSYGPLDPTDSFFIEAGREIVETGNYLLPLMNYEPWLDKPILYFWAVAGCQRLLGDTAFAGRIFCALTAVSLGFILYYSARVFIGARQALLAALIFYAFPLSSALGHISLTDMPLTLFISAGVACLFHFKIHFKQKGAVAVLVAGYFALALAFLCKGPIAVIIAAAILGLHQLIVSTSVGDFVRRIFSFHPIGGLLLIFAVNAPWFFAANAGTQGQFFQDFFITQNFGRMVGTVNHQQPFWFYIPVVLGGLFPWSLLLFSGPSLSLRLFKQRKSLSPTQSYMLLQLVWASFVLLLFSAIKTKLPTYILPAMMPLAILSARAASIAVRQGKNINGDWRKFTGMHASAVLTLVTLLAVLVASFRISGWAAIFLTQLRPLVCLLVIVAGFYAWQIWTGRRPRALTTLTALSLVSVAIAMPLAHMAFDADRQIPVNELTQRVKAAGGNLVTIIREEPSFSYYLHRHVPCATTRLEAHDCMRKYPQKLFVMAPKEVLQNIEWFEGPGRRALVVAKTRKWTLFEIVEGSEENSSRENQPDKTQPKKN